MKRFFYVTDDLDDLEAVQQQLEEKQITLPQIHVLSERESEVERHHLHEVESLLNNDVIHSTLVGAVIGLVLSTLLLSIVYWLGWTDTAAGWVPFVFLAVVILGFCTWEGGLYGIQAPHRQFKRFADALHDGKHVLFVDVSPKQVDLLKEVVEQHPKLRLAGSAEAHTGLTVRWLDNWHAFVKTMP